MRASDRSSNSKNVWATWLLVGTIAFVGWLGFSYLTSSPPLVQDQSKGNETKLNSYQGSSGDPDKTLVAAIPNTQKTKLRNAELNKGVSASADQWPTEAFSENATKWLKHLASLAPFESPAAEEATQQVLVDGSLRPEVRTVSIAPEISIDRGISGPVKLTPPKMPLAEALRSLYKDVDSDARCELKIIRVSQTSDGFDTVVHAEGGGVRTNASRQKSLFQWTAKWNCSWSKLGDLQNIAVEDYEEVRSATELPAWFADRTERTIGSTEAYRQQLLYGMDVWVNRLEHRLFVNRLGHHGLAIADFDGNGLEDLYVCQPGGLPNRLFLHQADHTAIESAQQAGVDVLDDTTAALAADLDNDGDQDLVILSISGGYLFENDGAGRFAVRMTLPSCRNTFSITAADYDRDGMLDLYVGRYWPEESGRGAIPLPVPYYDATNGGQNSLFKNEGNWKFVDVTKRLGLDVDNTRYTMAAAWEDYDNDGDQDLYVANDFGRNCLYRNDGLSFTNVAAELGVEDTAAGMSVSWADYDHDGQTDLYVGNMFSSAGGRIAYQRQYAERFDKVAQEKLQRLARGNSLFSNQGHKGFSDVSVESATTMGRWAWGSLFADINNDSWDDLLVANGHVTTDDKGDL